MNAERITRPPNTPKPMSRLVDNDAGKGLNSEGLDEGLIEGLDEGLIEGLDEGSIRVGIAVGLRVGFVEGLTNEGLVVEGLAVGQDDGSD